MRELAANIVASDPKLYNTAFLGSPNHLYQDQVLNPNTWGGAIELSIFAVHFQTEMYIPLSHVNSSPNDSHAHHACMFVICVQCHF